QFVVSLRAGMPADIWRLPPGFVRAAGVSVAVVIGLIAFGEGARRPFSLARATAALGAYAVIGMLAGVVFAAGLRAFVTATMLIGVGVAGSRVGSRPLRTLLAFGAFAAGLYAIHRVLGVPFDAGRAMMAGA